MGTHKQYCLDARRAGVKSNLNIAQVISSERFPGQCLWSWDSPLPPGQHAPTGILAVVGRQGWHWAHEGSLPICRARLSPCWCCITLRSYKSLSHDRSKLVTAPWKGARIFFEPFLGATIICCDNIASTPPEFWLHCYLLWVSNSPLGTVGMLGWHRDAPYPSGRLVESVCTELSPLKFPATSQMSKSALNKVIICQVGEVWGCYCVIIQYFTDHVSKKHDVMDFILQSSQCKYYKRDTKKLAGWEHLPERGKPTAEVSWC